MEKLVKNIKNKFIKNDDTIKSSVSDNDCKKFVEMVIRFLKIGKIDTKTERFDAAVLIESSWEDPSLVENIKSMQGDANEIEKFTEIENFVQSAKNFSLNPKVHWTPNLCITNAIGELKEEVSYEIEVFSSTSGITNEKSVIDRDPTFKKLEEIYRNLTVRVTEKRKVKGTFYQKLDLREYPLDIQQLSINISTHNYFEKLSFRESLLKKSTININEFIDKQQWKLLNQVKLKSKIVNDHFYINGKPIFSASIYASRYPLFFLYNIYLVLLLISTMSFVTFSFNPAVPSFRGIVCAILLIAPVNFRWVATQQLPSVRYLTRVDKYGIGLLIISILVMCWHALVGSNLIANTLDEKKSADRIALIVLGSCAIVYNAFYIVELVYLFIKRQKTEMKIESTVDDDDDVKKVQTTKAVYSNPRQMMKNGLVSL